MYNRSFNPGIFNDYEGDVWVGVLHVYWIVSVTVAGRCRRCVTGSFARFRSLSRTDVCIERKSVNDMSLIK